MKRKKDLIYTCMYVTQSSAVFPVWILQDDFRQQVIEFDMKNALFAATPNHYAPI